MLAIVAFDFIISFKRVRKQFNLRAKLVGSKKMTNFSLEPTKVGVIKELSIKKLLTPIITKVKLSSSSERSLTQSTYMPYFPPARTFPNFS